MLSLSSRSSVVALAMGATVVLLTVLSGCASGAAGPKFPTRAEPVRCQALCEGVDSSCAEQPQLGASTSLSTLEITFPVFGSTQFTLPGRHQLFIGFRLDASACASAYYLAGITRGPGALITVSLAQPVQVPGALALPLPLYQVVELPLTQFPTNLRVMVKSVHRNLASLSHSSSEATERTYAWLARS